MVRGSRQGESHGGVYLVDFGNDRAGRVLDWNTMGIDWQGRGWDRGLRGIEFDGETVYIAASDELFAYTPDFRLIGSWRNRYLKHCHEICRHERTLFLTSTGFDSILGFDLDTKSFSWGLQVTAVGDGFAGQAVRSGVRDRTLALERAAPEQRLLCARAACTSAVFGRRGILLFNGRELRRWVRLPVGAHNARPFRDGVLFNDTEADVVRFATRTAERAFPVPRYPPEQLTHVDADDTRVARQAFGRGLCVVDDERIAVGSSPSTITLHDLRAGATVEDGDAEPRRAQRHPRPRGLAIRLDRGVGFRSWTSVCRSAASEKWTWSRSPRPSWRRTRPPGTRTSSASGTTRFTSRPARSCCCSPR